ncbi:MAG: hypothetical protein CMH16_25420 [Methylobacterium sp.]|nr:hypothetical protein [Methylobacterium sp.]
MGSQEAAMSGLRDDEPLDQIEGEIEAGEARRAEWTGLIEQLERDGQDGADARCALREIEDALAALRCRRDYLRAMRAQA